ncbi:MULTISPECIES: response regulator transcription factor [unclassified Micromonospora]|uniref:hypothetical protein n=1 Tax=unclassified Micromonospora TaxID=2617518 RepID=UPI0022CCBC8B|nr:hypothetical protein [Micromonospora sp. AKA38]GHJ15391.1 hypothetical protein TPA0908_33860 [Micromonospora sp. AKA38]
MLSFGDVRLDETGRRAWIGNRLSAARLGWREFLVLRVLVQARGLPCTAERIWHAMPAAMRPPRTNQIGVIIHRLRARLGRELIVTGGGGWRVADAERSEPVRLSPPDAT